MVYDETETKKNMSKLDETRGWCSTMAEVEFLLCYSVVCHSCYA